MKGRLRGPTRLAIAPAAVLVLVLANHARARAGDGDDAADLKQAAAAASAKAATLQRETATLREQVPKLAARRKAAAAAAAKSMLALRREIAAMSATAARLERTVKAPSVEDTKALDGAEESLTVGATLLDAGVRDGKAAREAEDRLRALDETATAAAASAEEAAAEAKVLAGRAQLAVAALERAAQQAKRSKATDEAAVRQAAIAAALDAESAKGDAARAQQAAAGCRGDARFIKTLAALGTPAAFAARRAREDRELASATHALANVKDAIASAQTAVKQRQDTADAAVQAANDKVLARECNLDKVNWHALLDGRKKISVPVADGVKVTAVEETVVRKVDFADTNGNGRKEAFVAMRSTYDRGFPDACTFEVYEPDADCAVRAMGLWCSGDCQGVSAAATKQGYSCDSSTLDGESAMQFTWTEGRLRAAR